MCSRRWVTRYQRTGTPGSCLLGRPPPRSSGPFYTVPGKPEWTRLSGSSTWARRPPRSNGWQLEFDHKSFKIVFPLFLNYKDILFDLGLNFGACVTNRILNVIVSWTVPKQVLTMKLTRCSKSVVRDKLYSTDPNYLWWCWPIRAEQCSNSKFCRAEF